MPGEMPQSSYDIPQTPSDPTLPDIKPEDMQYFGSLLKSDSEEVQWPQTCFLLLILLLLSMSNSSELNPRSFRDCPRTKSTSAAS
jgi:hypothetical protein